MSDLRTEYDSARFEKSGDEAFNVMTVDSQRIGIVFFSPTTKRWCVDIRKYALGSELRDIATFLDELNKEK